MLSYQSNLEGLSGMSVALQKLSNASSVLFWNLWENRFSGSKVFSQDCGLVFHDRQIERVRYDVVRFIHKEDFVVARNIS